MKVSSFTKHENIIASMCNPWCLDLCLRGLLILGRSDYPHLQETFSATNTFASFWIISASTTKTSYWL